MYNKLHLVSIVCEKYDFLIQERDEKGNGILELAGNLYITTGDLEEVIHSIIKKEEINSENFKLQLEKMKKECSKINLHLSAILNALKQIFKDLFKSLDEMEKLFKK